MSVDSIERLYDQINSTNLPPNQGFVPDLSRLFSKMYREPIIGKAKLSFWYAIRQPGQSVSDYYKELKGAFQASLKRQILAHEATSLAEIARETPEVKHQGTIIYGEIRINIDYYSFVNQHMLKSWREREQMVPDLDGYFSADED